MHIITKYHEDTLPTPKISKQHASDTCNKHKIHQV